MTLSPATGGRNSSDRVLQPQTLKIVTFWHFCVKVQRRAFQKAFVALLARGYCLIPSASAGCGRSGVCWEGQIHGLYGGEEGDFKEGNLRKLFFLFFSVGWCP